MFEESTHIRSTHLAPSGAHSGMISASTMVGAAAPSCMISMRTLYGADMIALYAAHWPRKYAASRAERADIDEYSLVPSAQYPPAGGITRSLGRSAPVSRVAVSSVVLIRARL